MGRVDHLPIFPQLHQTHAFHSLLFASRARANTNSQVCRGSGGGGRGGCGVVNPANTQDSRVDGTGGHVSGSARHPETVWVPLQADGARHPCLPHAPFTVCAPFPLLPSPSSNQKGRGTMARRGGHTANRRWSGARSSKPQPALLPHCMALFGGTFCRKQAKQSCLGGVEGALPLSKCWEHDPQTASQATFTKWESEKRRRLQRRVSPAPSLTRTRKMSGLERPEDEGSVLGKPPTPGRGGPTQAPLWLRG